MSLFHRLPGEHTIVRMQDKPDDDPTRFLDGWQPRAEPQRGAPMPDLDFSSLQLGPGMDAQRVARLKQRGFSMQDVEDVRLPEVRLPAAAADELRHPRLLKTWQPGAWTVVRRRLLDAGTVLLKTAQGTVVEERPAQWLVAAWPPQNLDAPLLGRWPELALLAANPEALLTGLPESARLWLSEVEVDWALLAELVLHQDASLGARELKALRDLAEAERQAAFEQINGRYEPARDGQPLRRRKT